MAIPDTESTFNEQTQDDIHQKDRSKQKHSNNTKCQYQILINPPKLSNPRCSKRPIPCSLQILPCRFMYSGLIMPILPLIPFPLIPFRPQQPPSIKRRMRMVRKRYL